MQNKTKGFTLIELLIVIAIIAILAVAVILTLNPAELLRQSRDSTRTSDMATLKSAISLYLADVSTPNLASTTVVATPYQSCFMSGNATSALKCAVFANQGNTLLFMASSTSRAVNSTGWIPIGFDKISSGAPFGNLPVDPVNDGNFFYAYAATSSLTYELDARMESNKYTVSTPIGANVQDGGDNNTWYETGTNLTL